ncbi:hypothetical protein HanPSC8_Chr05g0216101 [Helianthus annuus]|nr:hypothetical protein HanPSC8_Chr05g0216101 [Helianthus annuus]
MSLYALLLDEMRLSVVAIPPHQRLSQELKKERCVLMNKYWFHSLVAEMMKSFYGLCYSS